MKMRNKKNAHTPTISDVKKEQSSKCGTTAHEGPHQARKVNIDGTVHAEKGTKC